ncbi:MAG: LacI family DNA-binding transcriptional regulator [Microbacterium sp.]
MARAAGVSISTVSYTLSGKRPVAEPTRHRVRQAIDRLGYSPHAAARTLAGDRTHLFALTEPLRSDTHAPTHMAFVLAMTVAARRRDYDILLLTEEDASAGMERVTARRLIDAILVLDVAPTDPRADIARAIDIPAVFVGVPDNRKNLVCVDLDFEAAAHMVILRLASAGHRSVGILGHPHEAYTTSNYPPRALRACIEAADAHRMVYHFQTSGQTQVDVDTCRRATRELIAAGATAIVIHAAPEAHTAVLAEIAAHGLCVPDGASLVSLAAPAGVGENPPRLDGVPLVPRDSAERAVELAMQLLSGDPPEPGVYLTEPHYQDAGTVAPPPR